MIISLKVLLVFKKEKAFSHLLTFHFNSNVTLCNQTDTFQYLIQLHTNVCQLNTKSNLTAFHSNFYKAKLHTNVCQLNTRSKPYFFDDISLSSKKHFTYQTPPHGRFF